jgi:formate hydrogenlyase transcriptional activator
MFSKVPRGAMDDLMRYPWPGNTRELQNYIERAVILSRGDVLEVPALPTHQPGRREPVTLAEAERYSIMKALEESHGVVGGRTTLIDKPPDAGFLDEPVARLERMSVEIC